MKPSPFVKGISIHETTFEIHPVVVMIELIHFDWEHSSG